MNMNLLI